MNKYKGFFFKFKVMKLQIKKLKREIEYLLDTYISKFVYTKGMLQFIWSHHMLKTYPDKFPNEIKYLKSKKRI